MAHHLPLFISKGIQVSVGGRTHEISWCSDAAPSPSLEPQTIRLFVSSGKNQDGVLHGTS